MSDTFEDLTKSVITPAPPLDCRVGVPCVFTLSTRSELGKQLPHGGLSVAVRIASVAEAEAHLCTDQMDGTYACVFPTAWIATKGESLFIVSADGEEFEPLRALTDPTTGVESTAATYARLSVVVGPTECNEDHSYPKTDGSACICEAGYYRREFGGGWSCERCVRGFEPGAEGNRCAACTYGKYSADGERCGVCEPGYEPNQATSAASCTAVKGPANPTRCANHDGLVNVSIAHIDFAGL